MSFVSLFKKGRWIGKAKNYVSNSKKMKTLISKLGFYLSRKGLHEIKDSLVLMRNYLSDITTSKYKDYSKAKLVLIVAAVIYVVSPLDLFPDFIFGGFIDDVSIVVWVLKEIGEELEKYKEHINKMQ